MAEESALEVLLARVRGIVGKSREKKLSELVEKRRRKWRRDCRRRNVPAPRVTYKRVEERVLERKQKLVDEHLSSVDVLTETRKKTMEDVRALETSRIGKILDNITRVNSIDSELQMCESELQMCESGHDSISNTSTADEPNLLSLLKELFKDISSAQTVQRIKAMHLFPASPSILSPSTEADASSNITATMPFLDIVPPTTNSTSFLSLPDAPLPPPTYSTSILSLPDVSPPPPTNSTSTLSLRDTPLPPPTDSTFASSFLDASLPPTTNSIPSQVTSSPVPMDIGNVVEVQTSRVVPTSSLTEPTCFSSPPTETTSSPPVKVVILSHPRVRCSTPQVVLPRVRSDMSLTSSLKKVTESEVNSSIMPRSPKAKSKNELVRLLHEVQRVATDNSGDGYYTRQHSSTLKR